LAVFPLVNRFFLLDLEEPEELKAHPLLDEFGVADVKSKMVTRKTLVVIEQERQRVIDGLTRAGRRNSFAKVRATASLSRASTIVGLSAMGHFFALPSSGPERHLPANAWRKSRSRTAEKSSTPPDHNAHFQATPSPM
jgi:hypothetical protein